MRVQDYPAIKRALTEIAYDNGMVHRDQAEWLALYDMFDLITKKYTPAQIAEVERELAALTPKQLIEACTGGRGEGLTRPIADDGLADEMLDWAFDGDVTTLDQQTTRPTP
jgi:hypothetical protein